MSDTDQGDPSPSPQRLRDRAAGIRWAASAIQDEDRVRELLEFAARLEAEAALLEEGGEDQPEIGC